MINDYRKWPIKRLGLNWERPGPNKRKIHSSAYLKLGINLNKRNEIHFFWMNFAFIIDF